VKLYLLRHGDAVPEDRDLSDRDRYLSSRGREMCRVIARLLREQNVELDVVVTSPLARAVQTAELVASGIDYIGLIEALPGLTPGCHPRIAAEAVVARGTSVLVVGHEPDISALGGYVLGRPGFPQFRVGQLYAIEDARPTWTARADVGQVEAYNVA
jgi:phosphohistidine phosphatase